jgi:hypothetical protein
MTTAAIMSAMQTILFATQDALSANYFVNTEAIKAVDVGSYKMLDQGVKCAAVILPGRFVSQDGSYEDVRNEDILVDLFYRYDSDAGTNWDNFTAFRDAVRDKLKSYPTLNGLDGVSQVSVAAEDDPEPVVKAKNPEAGPVFILQRLRVTVTQRVAMTTGEYAS